MYSSETYIRLKWSHVKNLSLEIIVTYVVDGFHMFSWQGYFRNRFLPMPSRSNLFSSVSDSSCSMHILSQIACLLCGIDCIPIAPVHIHISYIIFVVYNIAKWFFSVSVKPQVTIQYNCMQIKGSVSWSCVSVTFMYLYITLVSISFLPVIILIDFHWEQIYKLECVNKMIISPSG